MTHYANRLSDKGTKSAAYYDEYLRLIQTVSDNHKGGLDIVSHRINFTGDVLLTQENHSATGTPVIVQHEFSYDNAKRLTKTKHKINNLYQLTLSEDKYEETGRLKRKYLHETSVSLLPTTSFPVLGNDLILPRHKCMQLIGCNERYPSCQHYLYKLAGDYSFKFWGSRSSSLLAG